MAQQANLSIGALAHATGVPTNTLRTWERRYGFPRSVRLPSGHRRYEQEQITYIRWIIRALEAGHRPSSLGSLDLPTLRDLVTESRSQPSGNADALSTQIEIWLESVQKLDMTGLEKAMLKDWSRHGAVYFLDGLVGQFLTTVGQRWADGVLTIAQEHAASECLVTFLSSRWRAMEQGATGHAAVLSTLPGERHALGLHQAAVILAINGFKIHFLGNDTPIDELVSTANDVVADAVMVSVSIAAPKTDSREKLLELRAKLSPNVQLVVGGRGAPEDLSQMKVMESMSQLEEWALKHQRATQPSHH